ncbi:MAG: ATP-binding protein [Chromatiales bacterium]
MTWHGDMLTDLAAMQSARQFRMRRLQVLNWGTFSDLHDIAIAEDGFLIVGRSGSGKSTLLDALAALLVPPQWLVFNAAARDGERSRRDRSLASYVRGAWGDQKDTESGEIATRFLRTGTTWSALALTFANGEGRQVSLVQLYWLRGVASASADVKRHYMIAERAFDIARELEGFELDVRDLKRRLVDVDHFGDTFRPYAERFRRLLGIESEMALKLLHKTQSAKNLGDLNSFLREFMLDEPESFGAADRLVAEFAELDAAHREVVTARRQVDTLKPARDDCARVQGLDRDIDGREQLLLAIDGYCDETRIGLLDERIRGLRTRDRGLEGEERRQQDGLDRLEGALETLEAEHRQAGGDRIEHLERQRLEAEKQRDERLKRRGQAEAACRTLGWTLSDNARAYSGQITEARSIAESWHRAQEDADDRRDALRDEKSALETEFAGVRREVEAMQRQPSNIPAHMLDLRRTLAEGLGLGESELPFVGELIQVREEAGDWRGAIERVLRGFALSLLVDERRYAAVAQYVNDTHLGQRLVYYRVPDAAPAALPPAPPLSLTRKLELKETTYRPWLEAELGRRFDYACVDTLRDFRREDRALTRQGQVRHGRARHEKDDRSRVDDRRRWVLGFDNRAKLALYTRRAQELAQEITALQRRLTALQQDRVAQQERFQASIALTQLDWRDIDVADTLDHLQALQRQLHELRRGNEALRRLGERIERQRADIKAARDALVKTRADRQQLADEIDRLAREREGLEQRLESAVRPGAEQCALLQERFGAGDTLTLENLDERRRSAERAIHGELRALREERSHCVRRIERAFGEFKREWPQEGADFDATLDAAPDFLALLQRLEYDGLPGHEQRFFDMLKEQSTENLAALNAHISQARKDIYARMESVNEGLADAEFNPGTHLQITIADRHLEDVREFRREVQQVLGHAWQMDRASAEERFLVLRRLVQRLGGQDPDQRRWRQQVLDVRLHVEFIGRELDRAGAEVELYRSGAGKSGGQREKLSTTCLAAALRYQLGGAEGGLPVYAPVVLDEAFGKADNEFTELAMRIFERFGFQMIVATPLKSVMTLEPFIGGACFVDIAERRRSATLAIEYDTHHRRLRLPAQARVEDIPA